MSSPQLLLLLTAMLLFGRDLHGQAAGIEASAQFRAEKVVTYPGAESITWNERGELWFVARHQNELSIASIAQPKTGEITLHKTVKSKGNRHASLLVMGNKIFVADGAVLRVLTKTGNDSEGEVFRPDPSLFPRNVELSFLSWSPNGFIHFLYGSMASGEAGIGRVNLRGGKWDVVAKGSFSSVAFDSVGFAVAADASARSLFRVASGLDYDAGLQGYQKSDLALKIDRPIGRASIAMIYTGSGWSQTNQGKWIIYDEASNSIEQYSEEQGQLRHWRRVAALNREAELRTMQIGPDGAVWFLVVPREESGKGKPAVIYRVETVEPGVVPQVKDMTSWTTAKVVAEFGNPNSWQRDAALRILDERDDLLRARGLHPGTPLHDMFQEKTNRAEARIYALLSLHRTGLLDETMLENACDDPEIAMRIWAGLLLGERNYPSGTAFKKIMELAKSTNISVRSAAAIAARHFVSGSLTVDTTPRAMPIREVFTGGILSTLWFSTDKGSSPEFDLLFWNAVRPITAFDHAHPLGFFNGDKDSKLPIALWIVGLITRQIAESDDPLKQQDAMEMLAQLRPDNQGMILRALQGLRNGTRRVNPTEKSLQVLAKFASSENSQIAGVARHVHDNWKQPFR